jgi:hypothetical protein
MPQLFRAFDYVLCVAAFFLTGIAVVPLMTTWIRWAKFYSFPLTKTLRAELLFCGFLLCVFDARFSIHPTSVITLPSSPAS